MKKKEIALLNRANKDIWALLEVGLKTKNFAILEKNLHRLASLQKYYTDLLNYQEFEIIALQNDLDAERHLTNDYEKEWLEGISKRLGSFENTKERIEELFIKQK